MSKVPEKFSCDYEECNTVAVTWDEALSRRWHIVAYSPEPKYVSINLWENAHNIPKSIRQWHACCLSHGLKLVENAAVNL